MNYWSTTAGATVRARNYRNLHAAYHSYKSLHTLMLISRFICDKPLTAAQKRKLPRELRERMDLED